MTAQRLSLSAHPDGHTRRRLMLGSAGNLLLSGHALIPLGQESIAQESATKAVVPSDYFGLHIHRADTTTPWPAIPFGSWRLWDAYTSWPHLEPEPERWDFRRLDACVTMAAKSGVNVLLPLGLSPAWASARPEEPSSYRPGNAAEPIRLSDWRRYVRKVADRYKGRITHFEVWNEVNVKSFFSGSPETLVEMVRIAHEEIKSVDPAAQMVTPSVVGGGRHLRWLEQYLRLGGWRYADIVGYHFYTPKDAPEAMLPLIRDVQNVMRQYGLGDKPLWNTESGWWIENLAPTPRVGAAQADWLQLGQETAQAYVARALILGWAFGLSRYYWYAWDSLDMGLWDAAARQIKPAAATYARVAGWMTNCVVQDCGKSMGVWTCTLIEPNGESRHIVWRVNGSPTWWAIPAAWQARKSETLDGAVAKAGPTLLLSESPILIH